MKTSIVELVGLAGAGKSSLANALLEKDANMVASRRLNVKEIRLSPFLLKHAVRSIPQLSWQLRPDGRPSVEVTKAFVYVNSWDRVLKEQTIARNTCVLIDQGPVFKLATLHGFGPRTLQKECSRFWWEKTFDRWADTMSMIVQMVSPKDVLVKRAQNRHKYHVLKHMNAQQCAEFFAIYNSSYEYVINEFKARNKVSIIAVDSNSQSIDETAMCILDEINAYRDMACACTVDKDRSRASR